MTESQKENLQVPARTIAPPATISMEAKASLINGSPLAAILFTDPEPSPDDKDAWRRLLAKRDEFGTPLVAKAKDAFPCDLLTCDLSEAALYQLTPRTLPPGAQDRAVLFLHGGGYTSGGGMAGAYMAMPLAHKLGLTTFALDYRMPPDHPFPAALDDTVEAYEFLLRDRAPHNILIAGRSAGGGLAAAFVLKARDAGLPLPAACILQTPSVDLTESGDSFALNNGVDNFLRPLPNAIALYANGADLRDPYLSPLFGDFKPGFPPTILTSGTRDLFLSNTVLMHRALRRAGIPAELHIWEAMGHGGFFGLAPEDEEVWDELRQFTERHLLTAPADLLVEPGFG